MGGPPQQPPTFPTGVGKIDWDNASQTWINSIVNGPLSGWLENVFERIVARILAVYWSMAVATQGKFGKLVGEAMSTVDDQAGVALANMAAVGLSDFLGVEVSAAEIKNHKGVLGGRELGERIGRMVMQGMFGALESTPSLTPEQGRRNAERLIGFHVTTALEGWMAGVLAPGWLGRFLPNWADLDDVMSETLGLRRNASRALGPLVDALMVEPLTRDINLRFRPQEFNEAQAARAFNRGRIRDTEYFELMGQRGWSRERAAELLLLNSSLLGRSDIAALFRSKAVGEAEALKMYQALGFSEPTARTALALDVREDLNKANSATVSVARDMFREREITASEYRHALATMGFSEAEIKAWISLGEVEQSRPRRLSRGEMEGMFLDDVVNVGELRRFYTLSGYSTTDATRLELSILKRKAELIRKQLEAQAKKDAPKIARISQSAMERAHALGLVDTPRLLAFYTAEGFPAADLAVLVQLAESRRAELVRQVPQAAFEEAHRVGLVDSGQLAGHYAVLGFGPDQVPLMLELAERRRTAYEDAQKAEPAPPAPRGAFEEAHRVGIIDSDRLRGLYGRLGFPAGQVDVLMALAERKRKSFADTQAKAAAPPAPLDVPETDLEAAFVRDLVPEDVLAAFYAAAGFAPDAIEVMLAVKRDQQAEFLERLARAQAAAASAEAVERA